MLTILLDENIDGYADYLSGHLFSAAWNEISTSLGVRLVTFEMVGLAKGATDKQIWLLCQEQRFFLLTDNRNDDDDGSLQSIIESRNAPTSVPVFTISDISRLRSERDYVESLIAKLLEYLMDADNLWGVGRLYLP